MASLLIEVTAADSLPEADVPAPAAAVVVTSVREPETVALVVITAPAVVPEAMPEDVANGLYDVVVKLQLRIRSLTSLS